MIYWYVYLWYICTEIILSWDVNIITAAGMMITSVTSILTALLNTNKSSVICTARLLLCSNRYLKIFQCPIWKAKWFTVTPSNNIPARYISFRETFIIFPFDNSHKATYFLKLRIKTSARGDQNIFGNLLNLLLGDNKDLWDLEIYKTIRGKYSWAWGGCDGGRVGEGKVV